MKLGAYTACLHDKTLEEALAILQGLGLTSVELNAGGFIGTPHLPAGDLLNSPAARTRFLDTIAGFGMTLTALNCNGNPLHPDPEVGPRHSADLRRAIRLAPLLGVRTVITMSGLPAAEPGGTRPSWTVIPWDSVYLETLDYQWDQVAVPFWTEIQELAAAHDVRVAIEMHPHNLVFNPATLRRLIDRTTPPGGVTHVGAELDPSHLFWQHIDPVQAIEDLGELVFFAAAKDTLIHETAAVNGVLDDRFTWIPAQEHPLGLGGHYTVTRWPAVPGWSFVAVGRGHDTGFWSRFLAALDAVSPEMAVNIEHEDASLGQLEGLSYAAENLITAAAKAGISTGAEGQR